MVFTAHKDARRARSAGWAYAVLALLAVLCTSPERSEAPRPVGFQVGFAAAPAVVVEWRWPLAGVPRVVRPFDLPVDPFGPGHRGVDLASEPGATVRAAGAGVIWFAGMVAGRGVVSVRHPDGRRTTYEPLRVGVHAGAVVRAGAPLGTLAAGHAGCPVAACLHWGLLSGDGYPNPGGYLNSGGYLDPLSLLRPRHVRLYPS